MKSSKRDDATMMVSIVLLELVAEAHVKSAHDKKHDDDSDKD